MASLASCMLASPAALSAPQPGEPPTSQDTELQGLLREGERLWRSGEFKAARQPLEKATSLAERQGDSYSLARGLNLLGNTVWGFGDYAGAVSLHRRALKLFRALGKTTDEAKALNNIGNDLNSMGDYQQALSFFHQSVKAAQRSGSPLGVALSNIGIAHKYLGHYAKAIDYLQRALRLQKEAGEIREAGLTLNQLGIVSRARGEYEQALDFYRESLECRRKAGDRRGEAQTLVNMGNVYGDLGQSEASLSYTAQALAIAEEIGYAAGAGIAQVSIGSELGTLGRFEEALARCEKALSLFRQINRRTSAAEALFNIGELHLEGDRDLAAARRAYLEALEFSRATKDPENEGFALDGLAVVALRGGAPDEALSHLEEALALARSTHTPSLEFRVRADRARALKASGRHKDAFAEFEASARIANDLRSNLKSDPGKVGFLDRRQAVFTDWAEALLEAGRGEAALEVAEAGRARAIADLLAQRRVRGKVGERVILEQVRTTLEELGASAHSKTSKLAASASEGSKIRGPELAKQLARLRSQNRELASLITVE
ncbi:MAG TPA: tetratricopeptide repeat protein, partial [Myxococcaceae bacterium]|nr:tetratricopeptide repeat protein [Myxococcaceae bacterium]